MCMIEDVKREIKQADYRRTFVVVAPRILLAQQLCEEFLEQITGVNVLHVHSGETHHTSTTKPEKIKHFAYIHYIYIQLYSLHIIHYIGYRKQILMLIQYTLMKHTIVQQKTFFHLLSIIQQKQKGVISLLLHLNIHSLLIK